MIDEALKKNLVQSRNLPSPPGVATTIIELARGPEANVEWIATVLAINPVITAKIRRIANSPINGCSRKSENLRQALLVLGLNAEMALALFFSLLKALRTSSSGHGLDYGMFWPPCSRTSA